MTQDRIANWGESEAAARYQTGDDDPDGGDFIVVRDLDGERMLLKFDFAANEWQYAGDVDMGGGDLNAVGTARVGALEADETKTDNILLNSPPGATVRLTESQTIADDTQTTVKWDDPARDPDNLLDTDTGLIDIPDNATFARVAISVRWASDADLNFLAVERDGSVSVFGGCKQWFGNSTQTGRVFTLTSGWFLVEDRSNVSTSVIHQSGSSVDIDANDSDSHMGVWFV